MKRFKARLVRILYADTLAAEAVMGISAISIASSRLGVPDDRSLATVVMFLGSLRILALLFGGLWMRLAVSYCVTFSWIYFVMFVFLDDPIPHLQGGIAFALVNGWLAWRLQTEVQLRNNTLIPNSGY